MCDQRAAGGEQHQFGGSTLARQRRDQIHRAVIDPMEVFRVHGADAFRYYFMRECPFGGDGNYSDERFAEVYNADLANNLGNLFSRNITMCVKYFDGRLEGSSAGAAVG